jgi:hypothetical protein
VCPMALGSMVGLGQNPMRDADDVRRCLREPSWRCPCLPPSSTGGSPRPSRLVGRRCGCIVPPCGRDFGGSWSPRCAYWIGWWLPLRAWAFEALCTTSLVLHGRCLLWSGLVPAAHSPALRGLWASGVLACVLQAFVLVS